MIDSLAHSHSSSDICELVSGTLIGDPYLSVSSVASIESDRPNSITYFGHAKYEPFIYGDHARAILVPHAYEPIQGSKVTFIKVDNVQDAFTKVALSMFNEQQMSKQSHILKSTAILGAGTFVAKDEVSIGDYVIIGASCKIGSGVIIEDQVYIGDDVIIGARTRVYPGVRIMNGVEIGADCIIYPNAVIGADGFGHRSSADGYTKVPHFGKVIIEDKVEIGSNVCIDRGALTDTIIRTGAKLDNLIHIAHGADIGAHVAIAAQSGISGSSKIGAGSRLGGQVGVVGHINIAPNSSIQAQSGVAGDIKEPGKKWYGYPSIPYFRYLRSFAIFKRLPELLERIRNLEKR